MTPTDGSNSPTDGPPARHAHKDRFTKRVDFVAKNDAEQVATGIVMVPDAVDHQGDYATEETIRNFADQFEDFVEIGEADGGVMHAAFPSEWKTLTRNEVLDEAQTIGRKEVPAGAWIQEWEYNDDGLWSLIEDEIFEGFSIGAREVEWSDPMEQSALPDGVTVPDSYPDDEVVWELKDGTIREVSDVDIPAVPDAMILETKGDAMKALRDHLGNRDAFVEEFMGRGHSESDAEQAWEVLDRAMNVEGAGEPGEKSMLARAGKAALSVLTGTDDATSDNGSDRKDAEGSVKEGRTLSRQNEDDLKAVIDAATSIFRDAGKEPGITRFTDREEDSFDLSEHSARAFNDPDDEADEETQAEPFLSDDGEGDDTTDNSMTDDTDDGASAERNAERLDSIEEKIDAIADKVSEGDEEKDAFADAPEWAKALKESTEANAEAIESIGKQSGMSDQLGGTEGGNEEKELSEADAFKAQLTGGRIGGDD